MAWIKERVTDDGDKRFVACYRDPEGRQRSAGTYSSRRAAERAANREEAKVREGAWHDHSRGQVTFAEYVETVWLPSKQVETSTLAAYRSYLDKHFIPVFGRRPMGKILPSEIQRWVTTATDNGLSAASRGQVPHHARLGLRTRPGRPGRHLQPLRPHRAAQEGQEEGPHPHPRRVRRHPRRAAGPASADGGDRDQHRPALGRAHRPQTPPPRPRPPGKLTVEETIVEVSIKNSPTGQRMLTKPYPKDNEPRTMGLPPDLVAQLADSITDTTASRPVTCCSRPATAPPSPGTPSAPGSGDPPSRRPGSTSTSASTTSATPTPPGCSPAAPTSSPSWTAWVMPRSPPPRSTCTPCPTPTTRTSPPSTASATLHPDRHRSPPGKARPIGHHPFKRTSKPEWTPSLPELPVRMSPPLRYSNSPLGLPEALGYSRWSGA